MCKEHIYKARELRDEHNAKVKKILGVRAYSTVNTLVEYSTRTSPIASLLKTTTRYQLNKMFHDNKKDEEKQEN